MTVTFSRRRLFRLFFVTFLILSLPLGAQAAQPAGRVRIVIPAAIVAPDEAFTLGEVAEISGPSRAQEALSSLILSSSGGFLAREEVLRAIEGSGLDDVRLELQMSARVRVELPGYEGNETETPAPQKTAVRPTPSSSSVVKSMVKELAGWDGNVEVSYKGTVPAGKLIGPASLVPGTPAATLRFQDNKGRVRSLAVRLAWSQRVLVAARSIQKGTLIRPQDITSRMMKISRPDVYAARDEEVLGRVLSKPLKQGEPISRALLAGSDLVKKGRKVKVVARHGGLTATAEGVLLEDGYPGDRVRVRRSDSKKTVLTATIVDENTVEVTVP